MKVLIVATRQNWRPKKKHWSTYFTKLEKKKKREKKTGPLTSQNWKEEKNIKITGPITLKFWGKKNIGPLTSQNWEKKREKKTLIHLPHKIEKIKK